MVLFVLMLPTVIVPLVGLGVDATMLYIVQGKLAAAVDGAALGAGRLLGTPADPQELAGEFLRANFRTETTGYWGATNLVPDITVTLGTTKTIRVAATVEIPLLFSRIFGQPKAMVAANAVATRRDSRIMLVIDRSGSMNTSNGQGGTIIEDTKAYAAAFTQKFTNGSDHLGLVVFDGSAVVGYPTVRPWDPTITSASTGGPNSSFLDGSSTDMVHQIQAIRADSGTGIADALSVAYIELQKAHMKALAANGGVDDRLNSIVLMTDGVPSAVSLYMNNPNNPAENRVVDSSSGCTHWNITTAQQDAARMMLSWFAIPYNQNNNPPYSTSSGNHYGMFLMASLDPNTTTHTANWWMSNGSSSQAKDTTTPNPSSPYAGCTDIYRSTEVENDDLADFLTQIPATDRYGNSLIGTGYSNSHIVKSGGGTLSVYNGSALDRTKVNRDYHWSLAMWNAADSAAARIRSDVNLPNRAGDTQNMQVAIYVIGYMGNGGIDEGLLKRIANDKASTSYDQTKSTGIYVPASNTAALSAAFDTIASVILRLAY
jgi:hypothetical protein